MARHAPITQSNKFSISLQYLKKEVSNQVNFLHAHKHQSFLLVDFSLSGIKVTCKVILALMMDMIKSTQSTKFVIFLQYLKKEVRNGVHFLYADEHQTKLLQIGIIVFGVSGQACPKYPK